MINKILCKWIGHKVAAFLGAPATFKSVEIDGMHGYELQAGDIRDEGVEYFNICIRCEQWVLEKQEG